MVPRANAGFSRDIVGVVVVFVLLVNEEGEGALKVASKSDWLVALVRECVERSPNASLLGLLSQGRRNTTSSVDYFVLFFLVLSAEEALPISCAASSSLRSPSATLSCLL